MRTEINMNQKEDRTPIDLAPLCNELNLNWFTYQEDVPGQKGVDPSKKEKRQVYFIHEYGLTTGMKFLRKRDMAELVLAYSTHRMSPRYLTSSFIAFCGLRGARILTTMSEEARREVQRQKAALEAMKEASAAGEMVNIEAGVAPMTEVAV